MKIYTCILSICYLTSLLPGISYQQTTETTEELNPACGPDGSDVSGSEGTVMSPNYPNTYPNSIQCNWRIHAPEGTRIAIKFAPYFAIEPDEDGCYDYIQFFEYTGYPEKFCGFDPHPSWVSESKYLEVLFFTDPFVTMGGFSMNWTAVNPEDVVVDEVISITKNFGTISSPNYPDNYQMLTESIWRVSVEPGKSILIEFEPIFGIEEPGGTTCPYDVLSLSEGTSPPGEFKVTIVLCTDEKPRNQLLHSSDMYVSFKSDIRTTGTGFSFNFTAIDPPTCGEANHLDGTFGKISSPMYPLPYQRGLNCTWFITVPENMLIAISFELDFNIQSTSTCSEDYIQIFDGSTTESLQYLRRPICGPFAPKGFLSSSNQVTVQFSSSSYYVGSEQFIGFSLNWTAEVICESGKFRCWDGTCINETKRCDGVVDCPADNADELECLLSSSSTCGVSGVAPEFIWDSRIVGGHNAKRGSWPWQGALRYLVSGRWQFYCGCSLLGNRWALTASHCIFKGYDAMMVFGDHNLTDYDGVRQQNVSIQNIYVPPEFNWKDENGWIEGRDIALFLFTSPVEFTEYVKPVCLPSTFPSIGTFVVITGWGRLDFEKPIPDILQQARVLVLPQDQCVKGLIELDRKPADIFCCGFPSAGVSTCQGDSGGPVVNLNNGTWEVIGVTSFGFRCGTIPGQPSAYVNVSYHMPFINNLIYAGIPSSVLQTYVIQDQTEGTIMSPNYDDATNPKYLPDTYIRWYIIGPKNTKISVRFDPHFDIEQITASVARPCSADYLLIYDGSDTGAPEYRHQKNCGTRAPPNFEASSNSIIIEFWSDGSFEGVGFSFNWTTSDDCKITEDRCYDKTCIPLSQKCDGNYDCPDREDEFECAFGNETTTQCGKQAVAAFFPWDPLVIGGHDAAHGSWPWQVALYIQSASGAWAFACGGTLISESWVMTAAHCLSPAQKYQVAIGAHTIGDDIGKYEKRINATFVLLHPGFPSTDDIGFVHLSEPVDFTSKWYKPVCLPESNDTSLPTIGSVCVLTGWGSTGGFGGDKLPERLQQTTLTVLNDSVCLQDFYLGSLPELPVDSFICAGDLDETQGTCFGDSGGPLACHVDGVWRQYGIVSWGIECGRRGFYERVNKHMDLINSVMDMEVCKRFEVREGKEGMVTIPQFFGQYPALLNCTWLLRAPADMLIVIAFKFFDVEDCFDVGKDFLNIYDGGTTAAKKFTDESLCGSGRVIGSFESSTNEILMTFISDGEVQRSGFAISWKAVDNCESSNFRCWDGSCIDGDLKCNGNNDCSDKSDEIECPRHGQECGQQVIVAEYLWAPRIVGGNIATDGSWPWQVALLDESGVFCGGTIIGEKWILTAAQCLDGKNEFDFTVAVGENDLQAIDFSMTHKVKEFFLYDALLTTVHDIALLKLEESITFRHDIQPTCVNMDDDVIEGEMCLITGWGATHRTFDGDRSQWLRQARIPIANQELCSKASHVVDFNNRTMFCAGSMVGGSDACFNDVGGPLVCFRDQVWKQFGIVSSQLGCGALRTPTFYTKISYYHEWIERTIGEKLPIPIPTETTTMKLDTTKAVTTETSTTSSSTTTTTETTTTMDSTTHTATNHSVSTATTTKSTPVTTSSATGISTCFKTIFILIMYHLFVIL